MGLMVVWLIVRYCVLSVGFVTLIDTEFNDLVSGVIARLGFGVCGSSMFLMILDLSTCLIGVFLCVLYL